MRLFPVTGIVVGSFQATDHQTAVLAKFGLYVLDVSNFLLIQTVQVNVVRSLHFEQTERSTGFGCIVLDGHFELCAVSERNISHRVGIESFWIDSIQYSYPQGITLKVFQSPLLYFIIFTGLLGFINDIDSLLFSQTVLQLLVRQFAFFVDERELLVLNEVYQGVEACGILLVM